MPIPDHHKNLAKHLRERFAGPATVVVYRDNQGNRPIPIGEFGSGKDRFLSTIGVCDIALSIPGGRYEFAAMGKSAWLPNAIASSIYWLEDREIDGWPLVCEDVIRQNAVSTYRHMVYVPSGYACRLPAGPAVRWLLGAPIKDSEIALGFDEAAQKAGALFPSWLFAGSGTCSRESRRSDSPS